MSMRITGLISACCGAKVRLSHNVTPEDKRNDRIYYCYGCKKNCEGFWTALVSRPSASAEVNDEI